MSKTKLHSIVLRNVQLTEDSLIADKVSTLSSTESRVVTFFEQQESVCFPYPFTEVKAVELAHLRQTDDPTLIFKVDGHYFVCHNAKAFTAFSKMLNTHKCSFGSGEVCCKRLSAASDENGGCQKVRESHSEPDNPSVQAIERYPWITQGYEIFGRKQIERFVVLACEHHEDTPRRRSASPEDITKAKMGLAQFLYPHVEDLTEAKKIIKKNTQKKPK